MAWSSVGSVSVGPLDQSVPVGSFSMQPDEDTIWVRITQTNPQDYWKYSYGLLTWKTSFGQELGTIKVYGDPDSEVFRLGIGLPPLERTGMFEFTPRAWNRGWISIDNPPTWGLDFEAQSGVSGSSGGGGGDIEAIAGGFVNAVSGASLTLTRVTFPGI